MVVLFLAEGFEEIEAVTPVDLLRRAGVQVRTCSVAPSRTVTGAHGVPFVCDTDLDSLEGPFDLLILPGGMPGTKNLAASEKLAALLRRQAGEGKPLAAICAAPTVLGGLGLLKDKRAVCYPGMEEGLFCREAGTEAVVRDGNIVTSRGPGTAFDFGLALVALLKGEETARKIADSAVWGKAAP